jgi:hypothetical protein
MDLADHRAKMLADTAPDGGETMIKAMLQGRSFNPSLQRDGSHADRRTHR